VAEPHTKNVVEPQINNVVEPHTNNVVEPHTITVSQQFMSNAAAALVLPESNAEFR
jgi:hypothetical protein